MTPFKKSSLIALAALAAVGAPLLFVDAPQTTASWRVTASTTPVTAKSDPFTATTVSAGTTTNHAYDATLAGALYNQVGAKTTNTSPTLTGQLRFSEFTAKLVKSASDTTATASSTENTLFKNSLVQVGLSSTANCSNVDSIVQTYGTNNVGNLGTGNTFGPTPAAGAWITLAGGTLAPGAAKAVCVLTKEGYDTSTATGRRDMVLAQAGRQIRYDFKQRIRSSNNATWFSPTQNVTQVYTVKAPPIVGPYDKMADTCGTYTNFGTYGYFRWAWPTGQQTWNNGTWTTPAINRWAIMRKAPVTGNVFTEWTTYSPGGGNARDITSLNSDNINGNDGDGRLGAWVEVYLRGYLYAGDNSRYINSNYVIWIRENYDTFECGATGGRPVVANTYTGADAPGPHGL